MIRPKRSKTNNTRYDLTLKSEPLISLNHTYLSHTCKTNKLKNILYMNICILLKDVLVL